MLPSEEGLCGKACGKACGPDGISAEYLKLGGKPLHLWLLGIFNSIIDMEEIVSYHQALS